VRVSVETVEMMDDLNIVTFSHSALSVLRSLRQCFPHLRIQAFPYVMANREVLRTMQRPDTRSCTEQAQHGPKGSGETSVVRNDCVTLYILGAVAGAAGG